MNGVCTRWGIVYLHDQMPIDGNLYVHKTKATKRWANMQDKEKFGVVELAVMPVQIAHRILEAIPS